MCVSEQFLFFFLHFVYFFLILLFTIRFYFLYSLFVVAVICVSASTAFVAEGGGGFGLSYGEQQRSARASVRAICEKALCVSVSVNPFCAPCMCK